MGNPEDASQRAEKANLCQDMAVAFVDAFSGAVGKELCTLYCHHAMIYIPDIIRNVPLNIGDLSQQGFEHLLKMGKSDLHNFTNKRLRWDGQDKGRNYQVLAKERERKRIKRDVPRPPTRNERHILGGVGARNAAAQQVVNRAERRGQLASRSAAQSAKRVDKQTGPLLQIVQRIHAVQELTVSLEAASNIAQESGSGLRGRAEGAAEAGSGRVKETAQAATSDGDVKVFAEVPSRRGRGAGSSRGRGAAMGWGRGPGSRGGGAGSGAGRGRGAEVTSAGRRIPASASVTIVLG
jgi:hypothetical protein